MPRAFLQHHPHQRGGIVGLNQRAAGEMRKQVSFAGAGIPVTGGAAVLVDSRTRIALLLVATGSGFGADRLLSLSLR